MNLSTVTHLYDFTGRTVVITGGGGVLGGEMFCALVGCGASVAILDRDMELAERMLHSFPTPTGKAIAVYADVLQKDALEKAAEKIVETFGRVDCLINCAGGNNARATTGPQQSFFDVPADAIRFVVDLNLMGTILSCQVFGKRMAEQKSGIILNVASMASVRPLTKVLAYGAAKAGVANFTQWLAVHMAQEYAPNIRVNAVAPGFFLTEQNRYLMTEKETGELTPRGKTVVAHTPMARLGAPEDLLGAVLWLLSPASAFVTGIVLPIDGGFSAFAGV